MDRRSMEVESDIRTCDDFSDLMFVILNKFGFESFKSLDTYKELT